MEINRILRQDSVIRLICGRSRAGKTTYSKRFDDVVHLDNISKKCKERYPLMLELVSRTSEDITIDGIYEDADKRKALLDAYKGQGSECIWMDTPEEIVKARARFLMPYDFEPPTEAEGWDRIIRIRGDEDECNKQSK